MQVVQLTDSARNHIFKLMKREDVDGTILRVSVVGGGCSGMSYKMGFEKDSIEDDQVFESNGVKLTIDSKSSLFLKGIEIDYQDGLNGAGFVYKNPNAKASCGCGTSFNA